MIKRIAIYIQQLKHAKAKLDEQNGYALNDIGLIQSAQHRMDTALLKITVLEAK